MHRTASQLLSQREAARMVQRIILAKFPAVRPARGCTHIIQDVHWQLFMSPSEIPKRSAIIASYWLDLVGP